MTQEITTPKAIKNYLNNECPDVYPDAIVLKKDGIIEVKRSYFYQGKESAALWADKVRAGLTAKGFDVTVSSRDAWAAWPKTSYFVAIVRING